MKAKTVKILWRPKWWNLVSHRRNSNQKSIENFMFSKEKEIKRYHQLWSLKVIIFYERKTAKSRIWWITQSIESIFFFLICVEIKENPSFQIRDTARARVLFQEMKYCDLRNRKSGGYHNSQNESFFFSKTTWKSKKIHAFKEEISTSTIFISRNEVLWFEKQKKWRISQFTERMIFCSKTTRKSKKIHVFREEWMQRDHHF